MSEAATAVDRPGAPVAIVLSGGGLLLFTHIGVLEALEDAGLLNDAGNGYAQHDQVGAVVGTSAGSLVAAFMAVGYPPHEMWKVGNWRLWDAEPPADPHGSAPTKLRLPQILDMDWDGLAVGLHSNAERFKGFVTGDRIIERLAKFLYVHEAARGQARVGDGAGYEQMEKGGVVLPPARRKELYLVAANLSDGRETIFHFREHIGGPAAPAETARAATPPTLGREVQYAIYDDAAPTADPAQVMTIPEAVRCSIAIPGVFRPYEKVLRVQVQRDGRAHDQTIGAYYTDGGVRDGFALGVAAKLPPVEGGVGYERIFGVNLGNPDYLFSSAGHMNLAELMTRITGQLMSQTIYEADQDDADIRSRRVRTVVPVLGSATRQDAVLDARIARAARRAGYIAGAYFVYAVHKAVGGEPAPEPRAFLEKMLAASVSPLSRPIVTWDQIFDQAVEDTLSAQPAVERVAGRSRGAAPSDSHYTVLRLTGAEAEAFAQTAVELFAERYDDRDPPASPADAAPAAAPPNGGALYRDAPYRELDAPNLDVPRYRLQAEIVARVRLALWLILAGLTMAPLGVIALLLLVTDSLAVAVAPVVVLGAIVAGIGLIRRSQLIALIGLAIAASGLFWALYLWIADALAGPWLVLLAPVPALLAGRALYAKLLGFAWGELQRFVDARVSQ